MKFKVIIISAFTFLGSNLMAGNPGEEQASSIQWLTIEEVQVKSKQEPRKIFVDVYTDWCGWCKKMDKSTFSDQEVINYVNENYYAVKLDAESQKKINFKGIETTEEGLARAFRVSGYPTLVLINEDLSQPSPVPGYKTSNQFLKMLKEFNQ